MRRFATICIDSKTGMEMVSEGCSFNSACMFLENKNRDNRFGHFISVESKPLVMKRIRFKNATFYYDEVRGYLLREREE
jgi:hypothetical protein